MIYNYKIKLKNENGTKLDHSSAYKLYAALLEKVPCDYAQALHAQELTPVSQHLDITDRNSPIWNISLFGNEACSFFSKSLHENKTISIENGTWLFEKVGRTEIKSDLDLLANAGNLPDTNLYIMKFLSPVTFKSNGEYALFPSAELIVKSLVNRLNALSEDVCLNDPDAEKMLVSGVRISGYSLNSTAYYIKGQRIPSFIGHVKLTAGLSAPMANLWKTLMYFSRFSGVGIKTALGMGGTDFVPILR
ncbi:MAG: CRISPR-associated endoribonuclease Cas6 [Clostridia bacterium]|nr:CRISPR-associated endoribonuclease Cas6 [Clostridia bacterium]